MEAIADIQGNFFAELGRPFVGSALFDHFSDMVYFIKDREGRYVAANQTLVERCGLRSKKDLLGRVAMDLFPAPLGESFTEQDFEILRGGQPIHGALELHHYSNGSRGWCLTWKEPLADPSGKVVGISGISRDIQGRPVEKSDLGAVALVLEHIRRHLGEPLRLADLAAMAGLSTYQFDQRIRALFGLSGGQYVTRMRIEVACDRLRRTGDSISTIARNCGYGDQSAFARQFRQSVGLTPKAYREQSRSG